MEEEKLRKVSQSEFMEGLRNQEKICIARQESTKARLDGMDKALDLNNIDMERRLAGLNELRSDVIKDRDQFVRKDMYYQEVDNQSKKHDDLNTRIGSHNDRITIIETRSVVWTAAIGAIFAVLQIVLHFWSKLPVSVTKGP